MTDAPHPEAAPVRRPSLWANPDFVKLWCGQTISEMGSRITREGLPMAAVVVLHAGPLQMGFLSALGGLATLLFGLTAGVWVDRLRRRPILIVADVARALLLGSIPLAYFWGRLGMTQLYVVVTLTGICTVFFDVAYLTYMPGLVERDRILEGNSKLALSASVAEVAGPGVTGLLIQAITAPMAILFDAVSFLVSALSVLAIRRPEARPEPREPEHLWTETLAGLRFLFRQPLLRPLALRTATAYLAFGFLGPLYVLYALEYLHIRPALLGLIIALGGVGALLGATLAPRLGHRFGRGRLFLATSLIHGVTTLFIPLAGVLPAYAVVCMMVPQLFGDMAFMVFNVQEITLRQEAAPEAVLGRVNAGMQLLARGIWPIGSLAGGAVAAWLGVVPTLTLAAVGITLSSLWLVFSPLRRLR